MTAKTQPDHYDSVLMQESSEHRELLEKRLEQKYASLDGLTGVARLKALKEIGTLEETLAWQGANPKVLDAKDLRAHIQQPDDDDPVINKYRARITTRATAIRAYCVWCMGGSVPGIKECPSVTCPLYPFRMGKDPLRGYDIPKPEPIIIEGEEDDDQFEDEDEGDDADATE